MVASTFYTAGVKTSPHLKYGDIHTTTLYPWPKKKKKRWQYNVQILRPGTKPFVLNYSWANMDDIDGENMVQILMFVCGKSSSVFQRRDDNGRLNTMASA